MLIAETRVTTAIAAERTAAIRGIVGRSVLIADSAVLVFYVLVLSSTLLPSLEVLAILLIVIALVTRLLWRSSIRIYSQAQFVLGDTFSRRPPAPPVADLAHLPGLLREANLETIAVQADSPAVGKLIRELELRSRTGASIVGIERSSGARIINPGPDEDLQPGDQMLLLGTRAQIDSAKSAFQRVRSPTSH